MNTDISKIENILNNALADNAFPCYSFAIGNKSEVFFSKSDGCRMITPEKKRLTENTLFDMASLSKLIGTTMAALMLSESGKISLESRIGEYLDECHGKENITIFDLMTHTSGIAAHFPLWKRNIAPDKAADEILREPLSYKTGTNAVYSCMGYILLGKVLEITENKPLDKIVKQLVFDPLNMKNSIYCPDSESICAATERDSETNKIICGVVHDENARFLNGIAGNAGVFSDINDMITFAKMLSAHGKGYIDSKIFESAIMNYTPGFNEHRGLGFQIIGNRFGHNGFTGTSLYVDKSSGIYAILLTNRVHPTRDNHKIFEIRRELNKIIFGE